LGKYDIFDHQTPKGKSNFYRLGQKKKQGKILFFKPLLAIISTCFAIQVAQRPAREFRWRKKFIAPLGRKTH